MPPQIVVIGGANGSGKSTSAPAVLPAPMAFINADEIAKALPGAPGPAKNVRAGRLLLVEWERLAAQQEDFAVETTLAGQALAGRIATLQQSGYQFHLVFFRLSSPDLAVSRVAERVRQGGHDIPETTIRRRYFAGLHHFFQVYQPMADTGRVYDNSDNSAARPVAFGQGRQVDVILEPTVWQQMQQQNYEHQP